MARIVSNDLIKGISGTVGEDLCFRQIGGRTFIVKRLRKRPMCTENQGRHRSRFNQAVYYARTILKDPVKREIYTQQAKEAKLRSAYLAAMQDAMRNPEITLVYTESYHGNAGEPIVIASARPFKIVEASVTIADQDGAIVETGRAVRHQNAWVYIAVNNNNNVAGTDIIVEVKDRLGKVDKMRLTLDG